MVSRVPFPLLRDMETTVSMIAGVFTGSQSLSAYSPPQAGGDPPFKLFCSGRFIQL